MAKVKMRIRKGDKVKVIAGKDRGKVSTVIRAIPETRRVVVDQTNMMKKSMHPTPTNQRGGIVDIEAPMSVSNVMLVCPNCDQPTRVGMGKNDEGKKVRICKKCGKPID